jgi:hypothetical protein
MKLTDRKWKIGSHGLSFKQWHLNHIIDELKYARKMNLIDTKSYLQMYRLLKDEIRKN